MRYKIVGVFIIAILFVFIQNVKAEEENGISDSTLQLIEDHILLDNNDSALFILQALNPNLYLQSLSRIANKNAHYTDYDKYFTHLENRNDIQYSIISDYWRICN